MASPEVSKFDPRAREIVLTADAGSSSQLFCIDVASAALLHVCVTRLEGAAVHVALFSGCSGTPRDRGALSEDWATHRDGAIDVEVAPGSYSLRLWNDGRVSRLVLDARLESTSADVTSYDARQAFATMTAPAQRVGSAVTLNPGGTEFLIGEGATYSARWHHVHVSPASTAHVVVRPESGSVRVALRRGSDLSDVTAQATGAGLTLSSGEYLVEVAGDPRVTSAYRVTLSGARLPPPPVRGLDPASARMILPHEVISIGGPHRMAAVRQLALPVRSYVYVTTKAQGPSPSVQLLDAAGNVVAPDAGTLSFVRKLAADHYSLRLIPPGTEWTTVNLTVAVHQDGGAGFVRPRRYRP